MRLDSPLWAPLPPLALALNLLSAPANAEVQIILHAIPHPNYVHCFVPTDELGYQNPATQTRTSIPPDSDIDVFVYFQGYEDVSGIGFMLTWPSDWEYRGWGGDCLPPSQITMTNPGETFLDLLTAFAVRTGGGLLPIGFISFHTGAGGELGVYGTRGCIGYTACYVSGGEELPIPLGQTGRVAVGGPGYNPSGPAPVADATWGGIKAAYRN
jgi:hypothetical protein